MTWKTMQRDDRAVSIAVTHILTIGITTILISGLFVAGSGLLETERDRATKQESRTIGNRIASEVMSAYSTAKTTDEGTVVVLSDHQSRIAGNTYNVEVRHDCGGGSELPNSPPCLVIKPVNGQTEVKIALDPAVGPNEDTDYVIEEGTVSGGEIYILIGDFNGNGDIQFVLSKDKTTRLAPPRVDA